MAIEQAQDYKMEDLNLQVRLETCESGNYYDLTGRKTFSVDMFKNGKSFGITNIEISVNASLQPIVIITFKDLYGNTLFGTQRNENIQDGEESIDYSVLFNWPPPKFILTIKGYLGQAVSWILNLKKSDTSYNSSDGSFEIKCSFVPNQWGFFADIPFLYLLAVKGLKKRELGANNEDEINKIVTIFDYIKIGKQVEVQKKEFTKEFDLLLQQMSALKTNASNACFFSKVVSISTDGEEISGIVNNIPVQGFNKIIMKNSTTIPDKDMPSYASNPSNIEKVNHVIIMGSQIGNLAPVTYDAAKLESLSKAGITSPSEKNSYNARMKVIDDNITAIENEIKRRVFNSSEDKIRKLTISEVFSKLAGDTAYILGRILQAGLAGYANNQDSRRGGSVDKKIIGRHYPLEIKDSVQFPAGNPPAENYSIGTAGADEYGVGDYELKFLNEFIDSIAEGVVDSNFEEDFANGAEANKLKKRINNLEVLQENPYRPSYTNIIDNVFSRSAIISYVTRSFSPAVPGDFLNAFQVDNDDVESILKLVDADMENIQDSVLLQMSNDDVSSLKTFCKFWINFVSSDGRTLLKANGTEHDDPNARFNGTSGIGQNVPSKRLEDLVLGGTGIKLLDFIVVMSTPAGTIPPENLGLVEEQTFLSTKKNQVDKNLGWELLTLRELLAGVASRAVSSSNSGLSFIFPPVPSGAAPSNEYIGNLTMTSSKLTNNGIPYAYPTLANNKYAWVMFEGENAGKALEANSAAEDSSDDFNDSDKQDGKKSFLDVIASPIGVISAIVPGAGAAAALIWDNQPQPPGFVPIETSVDDENNELGRVSAINRYIGGTDLPPTVINYSSMRDLYGGFRGLPFNSTNSSSLQDFLWNKKIVNSNTPSPTEYNPKDSGRLVYSIYSLIYDEADGFPELVFGPFMDRVGGDTRGRNQRACLKSYCNRIMEKIRKTEQDKTRVLGNIMGNSKDQINALYNQFHLIFHQWNSVLFGLDDQTSFTNSNRTPCSQINEYGNGDNLGLKLEQKYSTYDSTNKNSSLGIGESDRRVSFVYEYPYNTISGGDTIQPEHSIVSIEPMYKPDSNTTVLNVIQNICTKNNFIFIPVVGNANYRSVKDIYKPYSAIANINIANHFHVLWAPTPENRTSLSNDSRDPLSLFQAQKDAFKGSAISVKFGGIDNNIIKNISVSTEENKVTAESIVNLQRLADNENRNKTVTTDCSVLSVLQGRSYKATCETLGNVQIYPMQFFYVERMPLFGGLYQIMDVKHSITPNNMSTTFSGIRMRFTPEDGYGGEKPITLESLQALGKIDQPMTSSTDSAPNFVSEEPTRLTPESAPPSSSEVSSLGFVNPTNRMVLTRGVKSNHNGLDVAVPFGTPLYAIGDGIIKRIKIQFNPNNHSGVSATGRGYGMNILLEIKKGNDTYEAVYGHMSNLAPNILAYIERQPTASVFDLSQSNKDLLTGAGIQPGSLKVKAGDLLGWSGGDKDFKKSGFINGKPLAGGTAGATGEHLHLNFTKNGSVENVLPYLPGPFQFLSSYTGER